MIRSWKPAAKYRELERELSTPEIFQDQDAISRSPKKHAELDEVVKAFERYKDASARTCRESGTGEGP
jgi:protein subunit release factor A